MSDPGLGRAELSAVYNEHLALGTSAIIQNNSAAKADAQRWQPQQQSFIQLDTIPHSKQRWEQTVAGGLAQ